MKMTDCPATVHSMDDYEPLPLIHIVQSDDYRARLLMASYNKCDERGKQLILRQAAAVAELSAKEGG